MGRRTISRANRAQVCHCLLQLQVVIVNEMLIICRLEGIAKEVLIGAAITETGTQTEKERLHRRGRRRKALAHKDFRVTLTLVTPVMTVANMSMT